MGISKERVVSARFQIEAEAEQAGQRVVLLTRALDEAKAKKLAADARLELVLDMEQACEDDPEETPALDPAANECNGLACPAHEMPH